MILADLPPGLRPAVLAPEDTEPVYFEEIEEEGRRWYKVTKGSSVMFPVDRYSIDYVYLVRQAILHGDF